MSSKESLPKIFFGDVDGDEVDWTYVDIGNDDDEELAQTPQDVIDMLGFDPLEE